MGILDETQNLLDQIRINLRTLNEDDIRIISEIILKSEKVFVAGYGRSGLIATLFGTRLHRLGFRVSVISEDVIAMPQPVRGSGNVVVAISGSGETDGIVSYTKGAKDRGAKVIVITSYPKSSLAALAYKVLIIKGRTKKWEYHNFLEREITGEAEPVTTEGSLFEISTFAILEGLALRISYLKETNTA